MKLLAILIFALPLAAQSKFVGRLDATTSPNTAPMQVGTSLPAACSVGDLFYKTDATAGQNLYGCTSTNTWTQQAGGGGTATAPYIGTFTGTTSGTILAATHGQGVHPNVKVSDSTGYEAVYPVHCLTSAPATISCEDPTSTGDVVIGPVPSGTYTYKIDGAAGVGPAGSPGAGYKATSTTSRTIGTGSVTFTTQSGLAYQANDHVGASSSGSGAAFYMAGFVTSYSGTTLVVNVTQTGGSGTFADWNIGLISLTANNNVGATANALKGDGSGNAVTVTGTATDCVKVNGSSGSCGGGGSGIIVAADASGSTTAYTSSCGSLSSYSNGLAFDFIPQTTNTGTSTLNCNSLGAKTIVYSDGTAFVAGGLVGALHYLLVYDSASTVFREPVPRLVAGGTGALVTNYGVNPPSVDITSAVPQVSTANAFTGVNTFSGGIISAGTAPTVGAGSCTGATIGTGATMLVGTITGTPTGTCTVTLTFPFAATTGWLCAINNRTTANLIRQTASTTTLATFVGVTVSGDVLQYNGCMAY